jgi:tRNA threonylcarbamoyladenosine biosynthesis protein TsaE
LAEEGLKLVEWPDKAGPNRPQADLMLTLKPQLDDSRQVQVHAATPVGLALLQGWQNQAQ